MVMGIFVPRQQKATKLLQMAMLHIRILEVPSSNLARDTDVSEASFVFETSCYLKFMRWARTKKSDCVSELLPWFFSVTPGKCWDTNLIRPKTIPSIFTPVYYSPFILKTRHYRGSDKSLARPTSLSIFFFSPSKNC
jgi:hypothetical protein